MSVFTILQRNVKWRFHNSFTIVVTILQPILWLVLYSAVASQTMQGTGISNYTGFILPGLIVLVSFSACSSGGIMNYMMKADGSFYRILIAPVHRSSIVLGQLLEAVLCTFIEVSIMGAISLLFSVEFFAGIWTFLLAILLVFLAAFFISGMAYGINGLIPHFVEGGTLSGRAIVNGMEVPKTEMYRLAEQVGSLFQNPKSQFFNIDSDSEITFGLENAGVEPKKIKERYEATVSALKIQSLLGRNIFSMSGGEKQSLAFASVYAMNPSIFVLDEPTANLDADAIDTLRQQIIQIKKEGRTVVIAEHRLYFLMDLIDRAIFIQKGKIVQIFSGDEFRNLSDEQRIRMGLRSLVHPVLELPPADPPGAQEGLSVENLSCAFDKQPVFSGLGFSAKRGEVLGIVGHNGAGKTTMTRCLCGLLKEVNGTVRLDGQTLKAKQRNKASFCVMQDVNHQLFSDSVWNECELAQPDCPPERIEEILRSFDLLEFKDRHPMALSGGQKQRLAVATAILSDKDVLVFDEPTSGLDYHRMLEVSDMIRKLNDENKVIIIVSHDFEFLGRTCDKIFDMEGCSKERR